MRNVKKLILAVTACLCVNSTVLAFTNEVDGFNNIRWSTPTQYITDITYLGRDMGFTYYNTPMNYYEGIPVTNAQIVFLEHQLVEVNFMTSFDDGSKLMDTLSAKHGSPITDPRSSTGGVKYWVGDNTIIAYHKLHNGVLFNFRSRQLIERQLRLEGTTLKQTYPH